LLRSAPRKGANDPAKRALLDKREELERKIDTLKYQKAAMRRKITRRSFPARSWSWPESSRSWTSDAEVSQLRAVFDGLAGRKPIVGTTPDDCHALRKHGHRAKRRMLRIAHRRARSISPRRRLLGHEMYQEANNQFRLAVAQSPANAHYRVRWAA